ncbi:MAG: hypothetical protein WAK18_12185 [Nocardioidaceae bacterium]
MNTQQRQVPVDRPQERIFHPRVIWVSVVVMILAMLIGAAAVIWLSWTIAIVAGFVFLVGVVLAWDGHIFRNVHQGSPGRQEKQELEHPRGNAGVDPDEMGHAAESGSSPGVPALPRRRSTDQVMPVTKVPAPAVAPSPNDADKATAYAMAVLAAGAWLLIVPWLLTEGVENRSIVLSHWRDVTVAVLAVLAGLRGVLTRGSSVGAAVTAFVAGAALVLISAMASVPTRIHVNELALGVVIMGAAALQLGYGRLPPPREPADRTASRSDG